jgi:hypothetical protein
VACSSGYWLEIAVNQKQPCEPDPGPNDPACPSSVPSVGATCNEPLMCGYDEGTVCLCQMSVWECGPGPACPATRPRLGSPCSPIPIDASPGQPGCCNYGYDYYDSMMCSGGAWTARDPSPLCQ